MTLAAQKDPCEMCDTPLDKYGLCPCIEEPALCAGAPIENEIYDGDPDDLKWCNTSLAVQGEDWHCTWPVVALRIKRHEWDFDADKQSDKLDFTYAEVSPLVALNYAFRVALVAIHVLLVSWWNVAKDRIKRGDLDI